MRATIHAAVLLAAVLASPCLSAATPTATLPLRECRLEQQQKLLAVPAWCGELAVVENPAQPAGRQIRLFVARIPAVSRRPLPDPLFILAGGPGLAATTFYPGVATAFARVHRDRDIVLVDQRGTGRSQPLLCPDQDALAWEQPDDVVLQSMRDCLATLARDHDVASYTTSLAVRDLDAVRAALGYERVNLYGSSYGTRVAQHYVRRYPQHARSMILDGVVPPQLALGPDIALDAQRALEAIFARCRADTPCRARFGDPEVDYRELMARLARQPGSVALPDPRSGAARSIAFGTRELGTVLRLQSYSADQAALLPLTLARANRDADLLPLAAQFLLVAESVDEVVAYGMHNSVVCAEDVPFFPGIDRERLAQTYLGAAQVDALVALCHFWPRGPMDADLHAPLRTAVPTLLLSGGADPVTPPAFAEQARRGFTRALHIVLPEQGHGQLLAPCMDRVMADFIAAASVAKLDIACTRQAQPPAFLLSPTATAP
jgi:pimeloyl-ACP methyl ester carboxylesterase